jgi:serine/threonine protein kinase
MPPPATTTEFLGLVTRSGLLAQETLDRYLETRHPSLAGSEPPQPLAAAMSHDCLLTVFNAEQLLLGKWRRFMLGRYRILNRLGAGSRSSVYLGEHLGTSRLVALKVLPASLAANPAGLEWFQRTARVLAALDHPNIVRAYDIDQDDNLHFLVLEYAEGFTLQERLRRGGPLGIREAADQIGQAASALEHARRAGVVHHNIKPSHLIVSPQGVVKLLGMGLARFSQESLEDPFHRPSADHGLLGTPDYIAPEQALDSGLVDIRADVYGLGATFYHCLTGQVPFPEGTVAQKLIWHHTRKPRPIREIRAEVPEFLAAVVERMMEKDPGQRYQTPGEVVEVLAALPLREEPPPTPLWPAHVHGLAAALSAGERCHFALHDALLDAGHPEMAAHFSEPQRRHLPGCWALERILGPGQRP